MGPRFKVPALSKRALDFIAAGLFLNLAAAPALAQTAPAWVDVSAVAQLPATGRLALSSAGANGVTIGMDLTQSFQQIFRRSDLTFTIGGAIVYFQNPQESGAIQASFSNGQLTGTVGGLDGCCTVYFNNIGLVQPQDARRPATPQRFTGLVKSVVNNVVHASMTAADAGLVEGPQILLATVAAPITVTAADGTSYGFNTPQLSIYGPRRANDIVAISVDGKGAFGDGASQAPVLSRDGQMIGFLSSSASLAPPPPPNAAQILRYAVPIGTVDLVSNVGFQIFSGGRPSNGTAAAPALAADGRTLAFSSDATNIDYRQTSPQRQIYTFDPTQIITTGTSLNPFLAVQYAGATDNPALSSNGRFLAFDSVAPNVVFGLSSAHRQVYRIDLTTSVVVAASALGANVLGNGDSLRPSISDDGRFVLFESGATNLGVSGGAPQIYLKDTMTGTLSLVSAASDGTPGNAASQFPRLAGDGRYAVFESDATNLAAVARPAFRQIYVRNLVSNTTLLASIGVDGGPANAAANASAISADGRYVAFTTAAGNLVAGTSPNAAQIILRDMFRGTTALVSTDGQGNPANGDCRQPALSANGRVLAFASTATNIDGSRTNGAFQVYLAQNPIADPIANGWWWNPDQPGRGYSVEQRGNHLFVANYLYAANGAPRWSAVSADPGASPIFSGPLMSYSNGQSLGGAYRTPQVSTTGTASFTFSAPDRGSAAFPAASTPFQRFEFSIGGLANPAPGYPETGWWWNPAEPGRGLFIEIQNASLFSAVYAYDSGGQPVWYLTQGPMNTSQAYSGNLQLCQNANCSSISAGSISLAFTSTLAGTATITDPTGQATVIPIQRYVF